MPSKRRADWLGFPLLSLANYTDMVRVQIVGARHAAAYKVALFREPQESNCARKRVKSVL